MLLHAPSLKAAAALTGVGVCVCLWLCAIAPPRRLNQLLLDRLVAHVPAPEVEDWSQIAGVVVAGGSPSRVLEALRLARRHPHLALVLTGPGQEEIDLVADPGNIAQDRVLIDLSARNTYENGLLAKELALPKANETWLLVTSAHHMPRALASFHKVGFDVGPWPVEDTPSGDADIAQIVRHEWLGLLAYRIMGRTNVLLPQPPDNLPVGRSTPVQAK